MIPPALTERIAACRALHQEAGDPQTSLLYFYELQGLLVAAGQVEPPTAMDAEFVEA